MPKPTRFLAGVQSHPQVQAFLVGVRLRLHLATERTELVVMGEKMTVKIRDQRLPASKLTPGRFNFIDIPVVTFKEVMSVLKVGSEFFLAPHTLELDSHFKDS